MDPANQRLFISESPPFNPSSKNEENTICYILSKAWWDSWCAYTGFDNCAKGPKPKEIDNKCISLSSPTPELYVYLTKLSWTRLKHWYGGGPTIKIFIYKGETIYDYYTTIIKIPGYMTKILKVPTVYESHDFLRFICRKFKIDRKPWKFFIQNELGQGRELKKTNATLQSLNFCDNIVINAEKAKKKYAEVMPLDIQEEEQEDEVVLQNVINDSLNEAFDKSNDLMELRRARRRENRFKERDITNSDDLFDEANMDEELAIEKAGKVEEIKRMVGEAFCGEKVNLMLHSLSKLKKELTQLQERLRNY